MRSTNSEEYHVPVLPIQTLEGLAINPEGVYLDGTLGGGGHYSAILNALGSQGTAVGIDRDPESISWVRKYVSKSTATSILERCKFSQFDSVLRAHNISFLDGILLDLGVSSHQIDDPARGFTYFGNSSLDMRMDQTGGATAQQILSSAGEKELADILANFGEVRNPLRMARTLKQYSSDHELKTAADLRICLEREYGSPVKVKVLAKVAQALRITVNQELEELTECLEKSVKYLRKGGRLVVIAYHSLEDRIVKEFIRYQERSCICPSSAPICSCGKSIVLKRVNRKAIRPTAEEIEHNRRSRSARLRVAEKVVD